MERKMNMKGMSYGTFFLMMAISFVIMYAVMFLNVDEASHIYLSVTRTYMSLLMVLGMAPVMMGFMGAMYPDKRKNNLIIIGSIISFALVVFLLRNQVFVSDQQYMKGMIPHHSSAIMVSKHATIKDPEVKRLSESIIQSQEKEISEMKAKLEQLDK